MLGLSHTTKRWVDGDSVAVDAVVAAIAEWEQLPSRLSKMIWGA
jgi:hypothetical protein